MDLGKKEQGGEIKRGRDAVFMCISIGRWQTLDKPFSTCPMYVCIYLPCSVQYVLWRLRCLDLFQQCKGRLCLQMLYPGTLNNNPLPLIVRDISFLLGWILATDFMYETLRSISALSNGLNKIVFVTVGILVHTLCAFFQSHLWH